MIQSPLNYTGGKYKLLPQILPLFPQNIHTFVDLFCGGCNVGINVQADSFLYNDICSPLIHLYSVMQRTRPQEFVQSLENVIERYGLSDVKTHGYRFYGCNSADGLSQYNRKHYLALRNDFNARLVHDDEYYICLYVLIVYAFNNQIRFNRKGAFNLPPGKRDFNQRMYEKLIIFLNTLQAQNASFFNQDFRTLDLTQLDEKDFVYADPPYLITCAAYNEQGGWTAENEADLLHLLDQLSSRNIRFALSNVLESKGRKNAVLSQWLNRRPDYRMIDLNYHYRNSNYQRKHNNTATREILVINY